MAKEITRDNRAKRTDGFTYHVCSRDSEWFVVWHEPGDSASWLDPGFVLVADAWAEADRLNAADDVRRAEVLRRTLGTLLTKYTKR